VPRDWQDIRQIKLDRGVSRTETAVTGLPPAYKFGLAHTVTDDTTITISPGIVNVAGQQIRKTASEVIPGGNYQGSIIASTRYYTYIDDEGVLYVDITPPVFEARWLSDYHMVNKTWRNIGHIETDATGDFNQAIAALDIVDLYVPGDAIIDGYLAVGEDVKIPYASVRLHVYEDTEDVEIRLETDKTNGTAFLRFVNDAQVWRIGVNNADKYSIYDATNSKEVLTIISGAPANSVIVNADGKMGLGVSPTARLHVYHATDDVDFGVQTAKTNGNVEVSMQNDAQRWDVEILGANDSFRIHDHTGSTVPVKIKAATPTNRLVLDSNGVGINTASPSANADLTLGGGVLDIKETTTPTADTNHGKVYTKTDNKLYFQDGAGTEHEIAFV
jgi:hypothetical protein